MPGRVEWIRCRVGRVAAVSGSEGLWWRLDGERWTDVDVGNGAAAGFVDVAATAAHASFLEIRPCSGRD